MFVFALEMPVNYVIIKTFAVKTSNSAKLMYRKLMCSLLQLKKTTERAKETGYDKQIKRNYSLRSTYIIDA